LTIRLLWKSQPESATIPQIVEAEKGLMKSVEKLVKHRQIIGSPPTLEDLVNPIEECEIGDLPYRFEGGDAEIVAVVQHEIAVAQGDVIELDNSKDNSKDDLEDVPTRAEVIKLCEVLEKVFLWYGDADFSLELPHQLCKYRAKLRCDDLTQTSLDSYFTLSMVDMD
jgi:hypothetical protein